VRDCARGRGTLLLGRLTTAHADVPSPLMLTNTQMRIELEKAVGRHRAVD